MIDLFNCECCWPNCDCAEEQNGICKFAPENTTYRNEPERARPPGTEKAPVLPIERSARPPNEPESKGPTDPTNRLDRAEIVQEIRELDSLRMESASKELADLCYHRINELLEMLDHDE